MKNLLSCAIPLKKKVLMQGFCELWGFFSPNVGNGGLKGIGVCYVREKRSLLPN